MAGLGLQVGIPTRRSLLLWLQAGSAGNVAAGFCLFFLPTAQNRNDPWRAERSGASC